MTEINQALVELAGNHQWLAPLAVFIGGVLTASNPCVLVMVPLMIGYVSGDEEAHNWRRGLVLSLIFVLGLSLVFAIMGLLAALTGRLLGDVNPYWPFVVGAVAIVMGLHLAEVIRVPIPAWSGFTPRRQGAVGAFTLGAVFGVVSTPCAVPILALVLTWIASRGVSAAYGALLLVIYALGHSVLILLAGTSMGVAKRLIEEGRFTVAGEKLRRAGGVLVTLVGAWLIAGRLWSSF